MPTFFQEIAITVKHNKRAGQLHRITHNATSHNRAQGQFLSCRRRSHEIR